MLFVISILIYVVLNLVPGGPFDLLRNNNPRITQSMIDRLNALLDLDKPLLPGQYCPTSAGGEPEPCRFDQGRYVRWLGRVRQGDFGNSWTMQTGTPVLEMIGQRLWYTLLMTGLSLARGAGHRRAHRHLFGGQAVLGHRLPGHGPGLLSASRCPPSGPA